MTDIYSLALVFIERLSGIPIKQLRTTGEVLIPDLTARWPSLPTDVVGELGGIFHNLVALEADRPARSAAAIAGLIGDLARRLRVESVEIIGHLLDNRYEVIQVLGQGAMARTYLAKDTVYNSIGVFALKKFLYPSAVLEQAASEFNALRQISSRHLPRIFELYPPQNDAHIKMEYIPGPTLQAIEKEFPWSLDRWWPFAQQLLDAVEELERRQLLHRDIKPANIILHEEDGRVVLIDFGFATVQGTTAQIAGTLLYQPPETREHETPPHDTDRYATGVVLFRALTGELPFEDHDHSRPSVPQTVEGQQRRLARVLLSAVDPDPAKRPKSVADLRSRLQAAMQALDVSEEHLPAQINDWVNRIRGLYRNSTAGNADNRGLDSDFVRETYVPTALDDKLLPEIFERRPKAIFLSGNPGDGKTAFLEQVRAELTRRGGMEHQADASGWEVSYDGHLFRSCYDASESHEGRSADQQLSDRLRGLEGAQAPQTLLTVLVAINDGRLADYFERFRDTFIWIAKQVHHSLVRGTDVNASVWQIDLKQRAFVQLPGASSPSTLQRVLDQLIQPTHWEICEECAARQLCPVRRNATMLRTESVRQRLERLFLLGHLRRQRHITMRDLRSALAYLITGNLSCIDVHHARQSNDAGAGLIMRSYWQSAFAPLEESDDVLRDLAIIDPARQPHPHLDRFFHFHQAPPDATARRSLFTTEDDIPAQRFAEEADWINAMKRRLYFEAPDTPERASGRPTVRWQGLLPYRYADEYLAALEGNIRASEILSRLARGLLRSDGVLIDSPPDTLSLVVSHSQAQQLVVLKQYPLDQFFVRARSPLNLGFVEAIPEILVLEHEEGRLRLELPLELYDLLMQLADGLQADAPEFRPLLEDLAPFKSALLLRETRDLVLIENQRHIYILEQRDGKIILGTQQEIAR